ncbi:MAG: type I-E CRISPR-associated protein Cse1/CasA [Sandaracinaceae bacterium]|nr:type I-E CRISPR-associated protein Cse1/CasA [Sandaracinaceae bacterium]
MNESDLEALPAGDPIDLLERPILSVADDRGVVAHLSLAGLLARIARGDDAELALLMPHQQHAMHAFVVQLMALVASRAPARDVPKDEEGWRAALRAHGGCSEAFQLVVADLGKPAFMQPPVPEGSLDKFKDVPTPDALDMLVLAKNHDVKMARIQRPRIEHWVFALISLQTQQGFSGRDNYGVARMNGGFGNRPGFGVTPSLGWTPRVLRDLAVALRERDALLSDARPYSATGLGLVWLTPWDGTESLEMEALDPFFIEVCRRVRVLRVERGLSVGMTSTKVPRISSKELLGNTGDLWTPVDVARGAALTLPSSGLHYARMAQLLFDDDWVRPPALSVQAADGSQPLVVARALVRGQGKTEGLHERVILVPAASRGLFARPDGREKLGVLSKGRIEAARALRLKVLKPAVCALLQGGADDLRLDDDRGDWLLDDLDRLIDQDFFPRLFADVERDADDADVGYQQYLRTIGEATLERGIESLPTSASRRERAIAAAEARFAGGMRKNFPRAFEATSTPSHGEETQS